MLIAPDMDAEREQSMLTPMLGFLRTHQAAMRTFQVPRYIQQAAKMSAQCRNTGFYLGHPYARWQETMAASTQIMLDPLTVATLEAEAEVRKGEREQARVEAELIDALRSSRR